ncbi:MAG: lasso peptide biosynthesis B2 protein [Azospirillaceae bacterium]|nr:lasso peptide biosynthesis B2 protein [Azospirillaceae bacterium]
MAPSHSIRRRLGRVIRLDRRQKALVAEAVFWLTVARLGLMAVPFPVLARRLGDFVPPTDARVIACAAAGPTANAETARRVRRAVAAAGRTLPFEAVCLPRAMAARAMLYRRGIPSALHFGAARGPEKSFEAHAWLNAAGIEVTGYPVASRFAEIACFV